MCHFPEEGQLVIDQVLLFDIDGTLTPPRERLPRDMAEALKRLTTPFHVAAGSHLELVLPQFLEPLWQYGFRKDFDAFLSNGATHFHCPFAKGFCIQKVSEFDFRHHLGNENYAALLRVLKGVSALEGLHLPSSLEVMGEQIIDRGSMLNFSPIGRPRGEPTKEVFRNRCAFTEFDRSTGYRAKVLAFLDRQLADLKREKQLLIMLGGETSFDLVIQGKDKTNAVQSLLRMQARRVIFVGDALFEGGNDSVISNFIRNWKKKGPCPVQAISVRDWRDTIQIFQNNGWAS